MASSSRPSHDYTEGASAIDIDSALTSQRRARRDSQHSTFYGDDHGVGSVFDGPGHVAIPSSVSRMGRSWKRRPSMGRRQSGESAFSAQSGRSQALSDAESEALSDGELEEEEEGRGRAPRSAPKQGVFESISQFFGGQRPELHRRGSRSTQRSRSRAGSEYSLDVDGGDDRWGYSSGEEDSADEDEIHPRRTDSPREFDEGSYPGTPDESLPVMSTDAIFGDEARIDIQGTLEDLNHPPPAGPPSRQNVYVADEDSHLRFLGYEKIMWRHYLWQLSCVLSFGVVALLGHWFPRLWLRWVAREKAFKDAKHGFVVIEVGHNLRMHDSSL
jgi:cation-transporting ATPase 13A2